MPVTRRVSPAAVVPSVPMAVEKAVEDLRLDGTFFLKSQFLLVASIIGAAFGEDTACKEQALAVAREHDPGGFGRQIGHLAGTAAVGAHQPDLRGAGAVGDEGDLIGAWRPARAFVSACHQR